MVESSFIKSVVAEVGFDLCGVTPAKAYPREGERLREWLSRGYGDDVEYMGRYLDVRCDSSKIVEGARSVIVCALNYHRESMVEDGVPRIAAYAQMRDYHKTIRKALKEVLGRLQSEYPRLNGRVFVDSAPLFEKRLAVDAGLGWIGRQSLLINPTFGSFLLLGEVVIDCDVDCYDSVMDDHRECGECRACIDSCPAGAINEDRTIDTRKCISCQTIEVKGRSDRAYEGWIFGCDECQECRFHNQGKPISTNPITARCLSSNRRAVVGDG